MFSISTMEIWLWTTTLFPKPSMLPHLGLILNYSKQCWIGTTTLGRLIALFFKLVKVVITPILFSNMPFFLQQLLPQDEKGNKVDLMKWKYNIKNDTCILLNTWSIGYQFVLLNLWMCCSCNCFPKNFKKFGPSF